MSNSRSQLERYLAGLEIKADRVLDIGGSQLPVKGRTKTWEVEDYKILDLHQPHECKIRPDIICDLNNGQELLSFSAANRESFGMIFCLEVMEYLLNPFGFLSLINDTLKPAGILYISFHFIYPIHNPHGLDYLRYTEFGAIKLLGNAGFKIESIFYKELSESGLQSYEDFNFFECNKSDRQYSHHNAQGYIIKAIKI